MDFTLFIIGGLTVAAASDDGQFRVRVIGPVALRRAPSIVRYARELTAALGQPERYAAAMERLTMAIAQATHNRIYQMLVHWHERIRVDLPQLQMVVRMANEPHLQGVRGLVELVRQQKADEARRAVASVHAWATPRMLAAAALSSGASLPDVAEGDRP